eukprot:Hpha_TRINITY_DN15612_c3_g3::TRINITY_DN15612_c3_g3_i2::g.101816::m.101816
MLKCCRFQWLVREGDSKAEIRIKTLATPFVVFSMFIYFLGAVTQFSGDANNQYLYATGSFILLSGSFTYCVGLMTNTMSAGLAVDIGLGTATVGQCVNDLANATFSTTFRSWTFIVLILDCALVFERDHMTSVMIPLVLIYMFLIFVESIERFGMYEAGYWGASPEVSHCNCASPPCGQSFVAAFFSYLGVSSVFLFDFYFTRGFSAGLRHQLRRVEASVEVAGEIVEALARYDVDAAETAIEKGSDLPVELAGSYLRLLSNLRSYREYLPETLLRYDDESQLTSPHGGSVAAPGGDGVNVGMVFTDIQSSTALWEGYPEEMYDALRTHNTILRTVAKENQGYEVKIIGDALMLAFAEAEDAVRFGTEAQLKLVQGEWPRNLCERTTLCRRVEGSQGEPVWNGVRVRIGINWGPAQAERNPVNNRYDYFGATVNTASR